MSFWNDAKEKVLQAMKPRQQQESQGYTPNRADGSMSGYTPRVRRSGEEQGTTSFRPDGYVNMVPSGVDTSPMQQFHPVGQTGTVPPQQGMPQQPYGQNGYPPQGGQQMGPQNPPRPQAQFQGQQGAQGFPQGGQRVPFHQNQNGQRGFTTHHNPVQNQPPYQGGAQGQTQMPPQQNPVPPQNEHQTFAFTGGDGYVVDGNVYKMVVRVAQITGVPSCFRVIEFMYNNEAVIVNAEQVTDLVEAARCMDLIFGAACAMKQRLMRVSGKQIYLITPPQVSVIPFDHLGRAAMQDIERNWPGALQANMQAQYRGNQPAATAQPFMNNARPMGAPQGNGYGQGAAPQQTYSQPRQDDFAGGMGRRAARNAMHTNGYTDYGGFGSGSR